MSIDPQQAMVMLQPWIDKHKREAWIPVTESSDSSPEGSKFSGLPVLRRDEGWPLCQGCQQPLELLIQLNLATLPESIRQLTGPGILQVFFCVRTDACEPGGDPFSGLKSRCRIIQASESRPAPENLNQFPPTSIAAWEAIEDYPNPEEHEQLGILIDYHFNDVPFHPTEMRCPELGLHFVGMNYVKLLQNMVTSQGGDKLGGWPNWVQGAEYPLCPECSSPMAFLLQIDSEDNVPYMFGDCGMGYVIQCREHRHVVALSWSCG